MRGPPAQPVITPRFVPTCTSELMRGLGQGMKEFKDASSGKEDKTDGSDKDA